jgi:hypothetical protein
MVASLAAVLAASAWDPRLHGDFISRLEVRHIVAHLMDDTRGLVALEESVSLRLFSSLSITLRIHSPSTIGPVKT